MKFFEKNLHHKKAGVFIDDSNLYYAQKEAGWRVDWKKLKKFLEKYCRVSIYNYYAALPDKSDINYKPTIKYLDYIKTAASVKLKPLKYVKTVKGITIKKGDVDVEIVLDVVRNIEKLEVIFVVSGDSDYLELKNWVVKDKKKEIVFIAFENNIAWELRQCWHVYLNRIREEIELKK